MTVPLAELERALEKAAAEALAVLNADRGHFESVGEPTVAAALAFLAEAPAGEMDGKSLSARLFAGEVTADAAARAGGSNARSISRRLLAYTGETLFDYMSALRFAAALSALRANPRLLVDDVAERLGLTGWRLRRLCREWLGQTPTSCQRPSETFDPRAPATWQRVASGDLPVAEQKALAAYVRDTWPAAWEVPDSPGAAKRALVVDGAALERSVAAEQLWPALAELPFSAQQELVRLFPFTTTAFFDLLREKSREAGRRDAQRGVELAELALLSLDTSASMITAGIHEARAFGWAWLGNAQKLALIFSDAEQSFKKAWAELALVDGWEDSVVTAEVYALKGSLRIFQRRFAEALALIARGLAIFKRAGDHHRQCEQLMRRAAAALYAGSLATAASDYGEALDLAKELKREDLRVMATIGLAVAWIYTDQFERGLAVVQTVDKSFCQRENPLLYHQVDWIEGAAEHGLGNHAMAEEKYLSAHAGFEELGQGFYTAFVALDHAILYAETDRPADVVRTSSATLRFFEALALGREALVSLELLKEGVRRQAVTAAMLREVRSTLRTEPLVELPRPSEPECPE